MNIYASEKRKIINVLLGVLIMAVAVMLMLNAIPASASGTGSAASTGKYSKLTVNATSTSTADMMSRSKVTNTSTIKRRASVSLNTYKGTTLEESVSSSDNVAGGSSLASPSKSCPKTHTVKGYSTIYKSTSLSGTKLETLSAKVN